MRCIVDITTRIAQPTDKLLSMIIYRLLNSSSLQKEAYLMKNKIYSYLGVKGYILGCSLILYWFKKMAVACSPLGSMTSPATGNWLHFSYKA